MSAEQMECPTFTLTAKYCVDPETSAANLLFDSLVLLDGVQATISTLAVGMHDEESDIAAHPRISAVMPFGADHSLTMVRGLIAEASKGKRQAVRP